MSAIITFLAQRIIDGKADYTAVTAKYPKADIDKAIAELTPTATAEQEAK